MKRLIASLMIIMVSVACINLPAFAQERMNQSVNIPLTVKERNGVYVRDYFFRRGIPLKEGQVYNIDEIGVFEGDTELVSDAEVMERHFDGSVRWMLVSAVTDLKPNELKSLEIRNKASYQGSIKISQTAGKIVVTQQDMAVTMGYNGIESILYKGCEQIETDGINLCIKLAGENESFEYLKATELSVLKEAESYVKLRLAGEIRDDLKGELFVTIPQNSEKIEVEYRLNATNLFKIDTLALNCGIKTAFPGGAEYLPDTDILKSGNISIVSSDNTYFRGCIAEDKYSGFVRTDNGIIVAPLYSNCESDFLDGFSRTHTAYVVFSDDAESFDMALLNKPAVTVDAQQFIENDLIKGTTTGALIDEMIESVVTLMKANYNKSVTKGIIPQNINTNNWVNCGSYNEAPGEMEWNFGKAYMATGNPDLLDIIINSARMRTDIMLYTGRWQQIYGDMRTDAGDGNYLAGLYKSHTYYSDVSGIYMAYLLTGDEYFEHAWEIGMNYLYKTLYANREWGAYAPNNNSWSDDPAIAPTVTGHHEIRGTIRIRCFYYQYLRTHDKKYLQALKDMLKWVENVQNDDGSFYQAYYVWGVPLIHGTQTQYPRKTYISLYGLRGLSSYWQMSKDEKAKEIMLKFADALCEENETFGSQGLVVPYWDKEVYATTEGGTRGISSMTDSLAVDYLSTAYEATGSDRYLKNMLSILDSYLCKNYNGVGIHMGWDMETVFTFSQTGHFGQCNSLLRSFTHIQAILEERREDIIAMGYEDIINIFDDDTVSADDMVTLEKYTMDTITHNTYKANDLLIIKFCNYWPALEGEEWVAAKTLVNHVKDNKLLEGVTNLIKDNKTITFEKYLEYWESCSTRQIPVSVNEVYGDIALDVNAYNSDEFTFTLSGGEISLDVSDGKFRVDPSKEYALDGRKAANGASFTLREGKGGIFPENGRIRIGVNSQGEIVNLIGAGAISDYVDTNYDNINRPLTRTEINTLLTRTIGTTYEIEKEMPRWSDIDDAVLRGILKDKETTFDDSGVEVVKKIIPHLPSSDADAARLAADVLSVEYNEAGLSSDIYLPKESLFGSTVKWSCDREDIISSDGILNRNNVNVPSVMLTAEVTYNGAVATKEFVVPLKPQEKVVYEALSRDFTNVVGLVPQEKDFEMTFKVVPLREKIDVNLCHRDKDFPMLSGLMEGGLMIRFNNTGKIDAVNHWWFEADNDIPWYPGVEYTFRVKVYFNEENIVSKADIYVSSEDMEEIAVGIGFEPRYTTGEMKKIDELKPFGSADELKVTYHSLYAYRKDAMTKAELYNKNNLMFGSYDYKNGIVLPETDNGMLNNWLSLKNVSEDEVGTIEYNIAIGDIKTYDITPLDVLKKAKILPDNVREEDNVTYSQLLGIIKAYNR